MQGASQLIAHMVVEPLRHDFIIRTHHLQGHVLCLVCAICYGGLVDKLLGHIVPTGGGEYSVKHE
jgi:hypothetical protein